MLKRKVIFFSLISGVVLIIACNRTNEKRVLHENKTTITVSRFDKELFSSSIENPDSMVKSLHIRYGSFLELYCMNIINIGSLENPLVGQYLQAFVTDFSNYNVYQEVKHVFNDSLQQVIDKQLSELFSYYTEYFPEKKNPEIIFYTSGFNQSVVVADSMVGFSIDKYLGTNNKIYRKLQQPFYQYQLRNMYPEKILMDCARALALTEFVYPDSTDNLINRMLYNGMVFFFMKELLPEASDTAILGFSREQMNFCNRNERQMWTYLVEQKLLFSTDQLLISKFTDEGPFTKDFTKESPAGAANWIGFRIVTDYMNKNKEVSLVDLMNERDYSKILRLSKYSP